MRVLMIFILATIGCGMSPPVEEVPTACDRRLEGLVVIHYELFDQATRATRVVIAYKGVEASALATFRSVTVSPQPTPQHGEQFAILIWVEEGGEILTKPLLRTAEVKACGATHIAVGLWAPYLCDALGAKCPRGYACVAEDGYPGICRKPCFKDECDQVDDDTWAYRCELHSERSSQGSRQVCSGSP